MLYKALGTCSINMEGIDPHPYPLPSDSGLLFLVQRVDYYLFTSEKSWPLTSSSFQIDQYWLIWMPRAAVKIGLPLKAPVWLYHHRHGGRSSAADSSGTASTASTLPQLGMLGYPARWNRSVMNPYRIPAYKTFNTMYLKSEIKSTVNLTLPHVISRTSSE